MDYQAAQKDLTKGDLGAYQNEVNAMNTQIALAQSALAKK
jgi:hypothetical protein